MSRKDRSMSHTGGNLVINKIDMNQQPNAPRQPQGGGMGQQPNPQANAGTRQAAPKKKKSAKGGMMYVGIGVVLFVLAGAAYMYFIGF